MKTKIQIDLKHYPPKETPYACPQYVHFAEIGQKVSVHEILENTFDGFLESFNFPSGFNFDSTDVFNFANYFVTYNDVIIDDRTEFICDGPVTFTVDVQLLIPEKINSTIVYPNTDTSPSKPKDDENDNQNDPIEEPAN